MSCACYSRSLVEFSRIDPGGVRQAHRSTTSTTDGCAVAALADGAGRGRALWPSGDRRRLLATQSDGTPRHGAAGASGCRVRVAVVYHAVPGADDLAFFTLGSITSERALRGGTANVTSPPWRVAGDGTMAGRCGKRSRRRPLTLAALAAFCGNVDEHKWSRSPSPCATTGCCSASRVLGQRAGTGALMTWYASGPALCRWWCRTSRIFMARPMALTPCGAMVFKWTTRAYYVKPHVAGHGP